MISRRGLLVAGFAATAIGGSGLLYKALSKPKQDLFPLIDPSDLDSFLKQTIDLARATPTGAFLYHTFSQIEGHHIRVADVNDQTYKGLEAAYSPETKGIVFKHPENVYREAQDDCDVSIRRGIIEDRQRSQCEDLNRIMMAQRTKTPQPGILVHELTHAAHDKYAVAGFTLDLMAFTTSQDAGKLYVLNEVMGDLMALKSYVELVRIFPEKEIAILQNVSVMFSSLDPYITLSHAMRQSDKGDDLRETFHRIIPMLIATGRYDLYVTNANEMIANMRTEIGPEGLSPTISDDEYKSYSGIVSAIAECKDLVTKNFIQQLNLDSSIPYRYELPRDEELRLSNLVQENINLINQWPQHLGVEGVRSLNLSP